MQPDTVDRRVDFRAGAVVALVGQAGQLQQGRRGVQRAEEAGGPGSGEDIIDALAAAAWQWAVRTSVPSTVTWAYPRRGR
jgi:hypothetical protein